MADEHVYTDLKNMAAWTLAPLGSSGEVLETTTRTTQTLVSALFQLPSKVSGESVVVVLPSKEVELCPREKPLPPEKKKSRWDKFAEEKGMRQRKRSRMVWDETIKDWAPRHGFKSIRQNEEKQNWIMEAKPGDDPSEDPFQKRKVQKQLDQQKQKYRELRNKLEAAGQKVPTGISGGDKVMKKGKHEVREALRRSQGATASHGRHDAAAANEKRAPKKKITKVQPQTGGTERTSHLRMLDKVLNGGINNDKAARAGIAAAEQRAAKGPKKGGKGGKKGGKKR